MQPPLTMTGRQTEHWASDAPGIFARVAELDAEEAERLFGPVAPADAKPLTLANDWTEVLQFARTAAGYFEEMSPGTVDCHKRNDAQKRLATRVTRTLLHGCMANGEYEVNIDRDLDLHVAALSFRAALVGEAAQAIRQGWSFRRCTYCGGWHRVVRSRHGASFCSPAHGRAFREENAGAE